MLQGENSASILRYFRPSLSYHLSIKSLFCLILSGRFTQVLLYNSVVETPKGTSTNIVWAGLRSYLCSVYCADKMVTPRLTLSSWL